MRILVANKFWYRRAGLEQVMFDEVEALQSLGHEVAAFSTTHPDNDASPWSGYFLPYLELGATGRLSTADKARAAARMFSNGVAAERFERLVRDFAPDVVHVHGIHRQLSPSILAVARRMGVPAVQTLHDMHKLCPQDIGLRAGKDSCIPRRCGRYWFGACVANRCRGSIAVSSLAAAELTFQRVRHVYERTVTRFIAPSRFLAEQMRAGGFTSTPLDVLPNPAQPSALGEPGDFFLFAGRLVPGKGVEVFLDAARRAGLRAVVAGDGPAAPALRAAYPDAEFLGWVAPEKVSALRCTALACVVPSLVLEVCPLAAIESLACGVPVIGSDLGGIPEIIDGSDGILVPPGDPGALAAAMSRLRGAPAAARAMGLAGREKVSRELGLDRHITGLLDIYALAIGPSASASARGGAA